VGDDEGLAEGEDVLGDAEGDDVGDTDGLVVGNGVGGRVGNGVGGFVGEGVGGFVSEKTGDRTGLSTTGGAKTGPAPNVGTGVGTTGANVGKGVGSTGARVGSGAKVGKGVKMGANGGATGDGGFAAGPNWMGETKTGIAAGALAGAGITGGVGPIGPWRNLLSSLLSFTVDTTAFHSSSFSKNRESCSGILTL